MPTFTQNGHRLIARVGGETLWLEPWGEDSVRVRATRNASMLETPVQALLDAPVSDARIDIAPTRASLRNGALTVELEVVVADMDVFGATLRLRFTNDRREVLLEEEAPHFVWPGARHYENAGGDLWRLEARFQAQDERVFGLGQPQHGRLDQKGCVVRLLQQNSQVQIPFYVSTRGYGFLWNNPAVGRVELAQNGTTWVAEASPQLDYWVTTAPDPKGILERYTAVTGRAPDFPTWALGFWQCKLRYDTQENVLSVAREHKARGLPLDVMVIDFFHWTRMGDWRFDPEAFPDPRAMIETLHAWGIAVVVSVWPTVAPHSENFATMRLEDLLVRSERGLVSGILIDDNRVEGKTHAQYYDAFNPKARDFVWALCKRHYLELGVDGFWLDANEPEMYPMQPSNLRFHAGNGAAVVNAYPLMQQRGFFEGLSAEGKPVALLSRSAWAGSQRFGALVWSGDVRSSFEAFRRQLVAGLSMAMSGVPWWTTDIGGFHGGDIADPNFRELLVRWFQWGAFCPVFRLHGFRQDSSQDPKHDFGRVSGADNEVWRFGEANFEILKTYLLMRERFKPYISSLMGEASTTGLPPLRPLFLEFPEDPQAYGIDDSYLFGADLLVAPVLELGARRRSVYLPVGAVWTNAWTCERWIGGQWVDVAAPLEQIPLFVRNGAQVPIIDASKGEGILST
jgi:alpha-D-xyloside xylohydrolase